MLRANDNGSKDKVGKVWVRKEDQSESREIKEGLIKLQPGD